MNSKIKKFAKGVNFERKVVYYPEIRPGFTSWVCLWAVAGKPKEYMLSFVEMRRGNNPVFRPVPLDFFNSMNLPYKYQITLCNGEKDIISENVILHSKDNGNTWTEVGRSCDPAGQAIGFTYESMPNGDILRAVSNAYVTFTPEEEQVLIIQKSSNNGNTWEHYSTVLTGFFHFPHRLRRLKSNTLVLVSTYTESFGPWAVKKSRSVVRSEVLVDFHMSVYISGDDGINWTGPLSIFQGYDIQECDFVELPSGDLLFIESAIFSPPNIPPLRQYLYKTPYGYIPGPVMKSFHGPAPEAVVLTEEGILVGATRGCAYSCSRDYGRTWYKIDDIPNTCYQPMIKQLDDGRFIAAWHYGSDDMFEEVDQFIGIDKFNLEHNLPSDVSLTLTRDMDDSKKTYINSFTAELLTGGKPLAGRMIEFSVTHSGTEAFKEANPRGKGEKALVRTDLNGKATLKLEQYDKIRYIHAAYRIAADFLPDEEDIGNGITRVESDAYIHYGMSHVIGKENAYQVFHAQGKLFAIKEIIEEFPYFIDFVEKFSEAKSFTALDVSRKLEIDMVNAEKLLKMLNSKFILNKEENIFKWFLNPYTGKLKGVNVINTRDYIV